MGQYCRHGDQRADGSVVLHQPIEEANAHCPLLVDDQQCALDAAKWENRDEACEMDSGDVVHLNLLLRAVDTSVSFNGGHGFGYQ